MLKKVLVASVVGALLSLSAQAEDIKVLGAASLKYVLEEIKSDFLKDKPEDKIEISYISSGKAYAQIKNGAPVHLFVAADVGYPAKLYEEKLAPNKEEIYAKGKLVLWSNDANFKIQEFKDILNPKITHIAIPNPKVAPYGRASVEALSTTKMLTQVESKNAEVGFTALSMLGESGINTPTMSYVAIDESLYKPINQALIVPNYGKDSKLASDFKAYILSDKAKEKFLKFGYSVE